MKKINKEFLITDSSVNVYGFRLLTEGYQIEEFRKNPIGYYMHNREDGVLVRWEDFRIENDKVFAKPIINTSNARGERTIDEINTGFLNGASVGRIIALEVSDDPALMLPTQTGPTITKWYNRECSLVDIPGNINSLALYDVIGNPINLNDLFSSKRNSLINLSTSIKNTSPGLLFQSVTEQLSEAYNSNTISEKMVWVLKTQYKNDPNNLAVVLQALADNRKHYLNQFSWTDLDKGGLLSELRTRDFEAFKTKYKYQFNQTYPL